MFLPLVENEMLKLLRRRRFRLALLILVALLGLIVYGQTRIRERTGGKDWRIRAQERIASMQNGLRSGRMPKTAERWTRFEVSRLQYHLDRNINPALAQHGGWVELIDVQKNNVFLRLGGGCQGCGAADITLKQGIEKAIRELVPRVGEILDTTDHASGRNPYYSPGK